MLFEELAICGLFVIDIEKLEDPRGFFARTVCRDEFAAAGLSAGFIQSSISYNRAAGALRGMHFQLSPHGEDKLVRVTAGRIFDVVVDVRPRSPSYRRWTGVELSADSRRALYIPRGCAHGFMTLAPDTEILYQMTMPYVPEAARGFAWNDPTIGVAWPAGEKIMSERDRDNPPLSALEAEIREADQ